MTDKNFSEKTDSAIPKQSKPISKRFKLHYCKYSDQDVSGQDESITKPKILDISNLDFENYTENKDEYHPFSINNLQLYNPIYRLFFEMTSNNSEKIALNHQYHMINMSQVLNIKTGQVCDKDIFVKYSPLLDPVRYMIGKYDVVNANVRTLPKITSSDQDTHPKMLSPNNASYVDGFFSYLTSSLLHKHGFLHGIDFYGSYLGIQTKFKTCITDDVDYLRGSDFFNDNIGKLFVIENIDRESFVGGDNDFSQIASSRRNKNKLNFLEDGIEDLGVDVLEFDDVCQEINPLSDDQQGCETVYEKHNGTVSSEDSNSSNNSKLNYSSDEDSEADSNDDSSDSENSESVEEEESVSSFDNLTSESDEEIHAFIYDFPVQLICLEKCQGTLDELFVKDQIDEKTGASALFQIIMILLAYQKAFNFTHNDLHTNNIMWINTDKEYLTYKFAGKVYRVPTYGKIYKMIDFGRGIYKFQDKLFCSDSFAPGGDAATQYNFEPFLNSNKPRLDPNLSFDLCRLGSSIFDFLMDDDTPVSKMNDLQKTIHRWCCDDNGKNVLYKKNGDERYPNFKLYKMIARSVHNHTPEAQLDFPYFKQFLVKKKTKYTAKKNADLDTGVSIDMNIDELPVYV